MRRFTLFFSLLPSILGAKLPSAANCTGDCQETYDRAYAFDSSNWVVDDLAKDPFWDTPVNLTNAVPGDIIRWETIDAEAANANWTIPGATSLSRFVYLTQDADGKTLPATAFALLPFGRPNPGEKIRTLLWAHGTAGTAGVCAPSNHRGLYYEWSAPYAYVQAGYAVIAPDYAGLGIKIPQGFQYVAGWDHAADAAFSIIAARKVIGKWLSDDWVAVGQSEGGLTTWRLNERLATADAQAMKKAGNLVGVVSIAPALRPVDYIEPLMASPEVFSAAALLSGYIIRAISGLYPEFDVNSYLTEDGVNMINYAGENGCSLSGISAYAGLTKEAFFKNSSWSKDPAVVDWRLNHNGEGRSSKITAPMLVVQGTADLLVTPPNTEKDLSLIRAANPDKSISYHLYEGHDHDLVTGGAQKDYLKWVADRFNGVVAKPGFSTVTTHNLTDNYYPVMRVYDAKVYQ